MLSERLLTQYYRLATKNYFSDFNQQKIVQLPRPRAGVSYMLYIHVPFCESLCPYCSFNRFLFKENLARSYFKSLRKELNIVAELGYQFRSLYIGGGTPTILIDELINTIDLCRDLFGITEISCETNPNHLTHEIADHLDGRVHRMSVGVQSFDNFLLKKMNRLEKFGSGEKILTQIQAIEGKYHTLNIDMIFNFPNQSEEMIQNDIKMVVASGANQVTFYPLMTAPSVALSLENSVGKVSYRNEALLYQEICRLLQGHFKPVSAWTFSRLNTNDMIDEYILENENFVGVGSGAFSYLDGSMYINTFSLNNYQQKIDAGQTSVLWQKQFSTYEQMQYRFMMNLFGLNIKKWATENFHSTKNILWKEFAFMRIFNGFKFANLEEIHLTPVGQYLTVVMMREFFSSINQVRDQARKALPPEEQALICINTP